jgi:predicted Zn-dependent peptidase
MVVFTQGRISFDAVSKQVEQIFSDCRASEMPVNRKSPATYIPQSASFKRHTHQTHVMLGGRAYPLGHKKQLAMYLLNNILGGGSLNSRLNLSLREKKGLVYTVESQYVPLSDTGYWSIYFATEAENQAQCLELIKDELRKLREERLSTLQLQRALTQLHGQMAISAENQENTVLAMGKQMLYYNEAPTWQETYRKVAQTTADTLQDVANDLLAENTVCTLIYE